MKNPEYVTMIGENEFIVNIQGPNEVAVNDQVRSVQMECIDGESLFSLLVGARSYEVFVEREGDDFVVIVEGERFLAQVGQERRRPKREESGPPAAGLTPAKSPLSGVMIEVLVAEGQAVETGDVVATLEAMKMENAIRATRAGIVRDIQVDAGQTVKTDDVILYIDSPGE